MCALWLWAPACFLWWVQNVLAIFFLCVDLIIRLTETISVHFFGISETGKENGPSKMTDKSKSQMGTKRAKKALLEVIPPRICVTFRRASFWSGLKNWKSQLSDGWAENTMNSGPGSHDNFSDKIKNHENRSELDPYSILRSENQAILNLKVLWVQWDPSGTPKLPYKIKNR